MGWKIFGKLIKGSWNKRGWKSGWDRRQKTQIVEVDISNEHIYSYAAPCISVRSFYFLCTAVNCFSES